MPNKPGCSTIASLFLLIMMMGCASHTAPKGWLPDPDDLQTQAFGAWMQLKIEQQSESPKPNEESAEGEFIAQSQDSVYILTQQGISSISKTSISKARCTAYNAHEGNLAAWTFAGTLSTLSHGVGLILSAPVWIIAGTISTAGQSWQPILKFPKAPWSEFQKYARFPQGLPPNVDQSQLNRK